MIDSALKYNSGLRTSMVYNISSYDIWVRSRWCAFLVTWFCYQIIAKPGGKTGSPSWPDPYYISPCLTDQQILGVIILNPGCRRIARLCAFSLLAHSDSKRHIQLSIFVFFAWKGTGIILFMYPANERLCYIVTSFLIGWAHAQNGPWSHIK